MVKAVAEAEHGAGHAPATAQHAPAAAGAERHPILSWQSGCGLGRGQFPFGQSALAPAVDEQQQSGEHQSILPIAVPLSIQRCSATTTATMRVHAFDPATDSPDDATASAEEVCGRRRWRWCRSRGEQRPELSTTDAITHWEYSSGTESSTGHVASFLVRIDYRKSRVERTVLVEWRGGQ